MVARSILLYIKCLAEVVCAVVILTHVIKKKKENQKLHHRKGRVKLWSEKYVKYGTSSSLMKELKGKGLSAYWNILRMKSV